MKVEPRSLQGFMELMPNEQVLFNKMKSIIEDTYKKYGFLPLDTPVIEYSEVLLAKAGGETEKQIYRFMKGDNDLSLRFDLTVPLAKYVAKRYNELIFPFKRYQIGKVFRGERPQKGRYREFYQCDIDVVGNEELPIAYDAEIPTIIYEIFRKLNIGDFVIRINNRKILNGLFSYLELPSPTECLRIIDKMEKIGRSNVIKELQALNIENEKIEYLLDFMSINGTNNEMLDELEKKNISNEEYKKGLSEIRYVINYLQKVIDEKYFKIDLTIARGLDYYTGTIYETVLVDHKEIGSICSGGRYDDLAAYYTDKKLPGVGISIGLTRLFSQLLDNEIIKTSDAQAIDVLIIPMDEDITYSLEVAKRLREEDIKTEIYYLNKGIKQKFKYADRIKCPYVIILGADEVSNNLVTIKNMNEGSQKTITLDEAITLLKQTH